LAPLSLSAFAKAREPLVFYARCDQRYRPSDLKSLLKLIEKVDLVVGQRLETAVLRVLFAR